MTIFAGFDGLTRAQKEIVLHWRTLPRRGDDLPERARIDPGVLRAHLASISMIEMEDEGEFRFRLVGSAMQKLVGEAVKGQRVCEITGLAGEMLSLGLNAVIARRMPVGGIIERIGGQHTWLRLPFLDSSTGRVQVLCHDALRTTIARQGGGSSISSCISNKKCGLAA